MPALRLACGDAAAAEIGDDKNVSGNSERAGKKPTGGDLRYPSGGRLSILRRCGGGRNEKWAGFCLGSLKTLRGPWISRESAYGFSFLFLDCRWVRGLHIFLLLFTVQKRNHYLDPEAQKRLKTAVGNSRKLWMYDNSFSRRKRWAWL